MTTILVFLAAAAIAGCVFLDLRLHGQPDVTLEADRGISELQDWLDS